jgi:hypothetical protein
MYEMSFICFLFFIFLPQLQSAAWDASEEVPAFPLGSAGVSTQVPANEGQVSFIIK